MPNDPELLFMFVVVIVIMVLAAIGLAVSLVKDLRDAKKIRESSKELSASPAENNPYDINLEVYRAAVMGSQIRRV